MTVENFWKILKHHYLHHLVHPRLDQLVRILIYLVNPAYMAKALTLESSHRLGRSKAPTPFQAAFKREFKALVNRPTTDGHLYATDVANWTCTVAQKTVQMFAYFSMFVFLHVHIIRSSSSTHVKDSINQGLSGKPKIT